MQYSHEDRARVGIIPPLEQPVFGSKFLGAADLHAAIVRLEFKKGGDSQSGNGFFVHIPGAKRNFILTAGHNLLSKKPHTDLKIRLFNSEAEIDISNNDVRVSAVWKDKPEEDCAAQDDYGVILLPDHIKAPSDFGFSIPLGVEDRLDCELAMTGYRAQTSPALPVTSTGVCVNPIMRRNQLEYLIGTEAGLSGSPVWVGYKTRPTVVAIHNYGQTIKKANYGSKGTRINLKCLRDIFAWTGVDTTARLLRASMSKPKAPLEPPLRMIYAPEDRIFRIIVDEVSEPLETMPVSVFPVYAAPSRYREEQAKPGYGFMQTRADGRAYWISWNVPPVSTASLVDDIRRAWLGRPEGKGWEDGKDFAIVTRLRPGSTEEPASGGQNQMVTLEYGKVAPAWRLKEPGETLDAVGYQRFVPGKPIKGAYYRWILESNPKS